MYQFRNLKKGEAIVQAQSSQNMNFNGVYINELIDGYRQLHVSGRHLISRDLDMVTVPMRNGQWFNSVRDEPRELTITYRLEASSSADMRNKMAKLNKLLNTDTPVPVVFDDEKDYTYYAIYSDAPNEPEQHLSFVSSFRLICPSPFKFKTKQTSQNGKIGVLENDNILPDRLTARVNSNTQSIEILNGTKRMVLKGNYTTGDTIEIVWGDEVSVKHNSNNALYQLQQFSFPTTFTIKSNDTIVGKNCTITNVDWRDMRR